MKPNTFGLGKDLRWEVDEHGHFETAKAFGAYLLTANYRGEWWVTRLYDRECGIPSLAALGREYSLAQAKVRALRVCKALQDDL